MSIFTENKWEADEVGDKLSKQLFKKGCRNVKRNHNTKLDNSKMKKNGATDKKFKGKNVKTLHQDEIALESGTNVKKRARKTSNTDNNCNNAKKMKYSTKNNNAINNKIGSNNHLTKANNNNVENNRLVTGENGKNVASNDNTIETNKKLKSTKKEKRNRLKNKNKITQQVDQKINIKRIEEMLLAKKSERKKRVSEPETLRDRMMAQLRASRFRYLNETLYNNQSFESRKMFKEDPDAFKAYHTGYRQQVEQWPLNPLDIIISAVKKMPKDFIIADFGCGEARLAASVEQKVNSLDLVAVNAEVIACDMARTPLLTNGINVVIFCLSLMGSNLSDYLLEANRVLKKDGILKIADIESRFENVDEFIASLVNYGFKNTWKDLSHNLFYFMDFKKVSDIDRKNKKLPTVSLKSCLYKKR